jgi:tetratricopeptide (TPR) repeat protein
MNFKKLILLGAFLIAISSFAQKDELKALKKIYAKDVPSASEMLDYKSNLASLEAKATEESDKVYANFYKCMTPIMEISALGKDANPQQTARFVTVKSVQDLAAGLNATLDFEKKSGKKIYTDDINETITSFSPMLINYAVALDGMKKFDESSDVLYATYQLTKNPETLYFAANYAVKAENMDKALKDYQELKSLNYSGEGTTYLAKNISTGVEETFATKADRDNFIRLKTHSNPRDEKIPSKKGEIYRNIALILVQKGKSEEAKTALTEARKENPEDVSILTTEADLYFKLGDMDKYKAIINEAIAKEPNNKDLIYNLGILSQSSKDYKAAEDYYQRVIDLDSNYINAYINLSDVKLTPDAKLVEEMNKLGMTDKDQKQYEVLKAQRIKLFNSVLPILEKAYQLTKTVEGVSQDVKDVVNQNLKVVYNYLGMTEKAKAVN